MPSRRTLEAMAPEVREDCLEAREQIDNTENFPFTEAHLKKAMEFERPFVEAGGLLAAGVDPTGVGARSPGSATSATTSSSSRPGSRRSRRSAS